jgi:hypothetical protein
MAAALQPDQFFRSYLVAHTFWLGTGLGCLVLLMMQHLTGGVWGLALRPVLESGARTLLPLAVLFVPVVLGLRNLYPWTIATEAETDVSLHHKQLYLNVSFFLIRTVVYFAAWLVLAFVLTSWSSDTHESSSGSSRRVQVLSGLGMVVYGFTITFASIDWVMSLEPDWYSTIYPVMYASGQLLTAFAFAVAALILAARQSSSAQSLAPQQMRDLGNLLLAFVMLWAYMSFSQFLLIWTGNLAEEIPWYLKRGRGGWEWVAVALFIVNFAVPFVLLLVRTVKENGRFLAAVAVGILLMRVLDVIWWIEPAHPHDTAGGYLFGLVDVAAVVGLGGVWMWCFLGELRKRPLLYGPQSRAAEGTNHGQS